MIDNTDLVNELHEKLDKFVKSLDEAGREICHEDIARLRHGLIEASNNTRALKVQKLLRKRSYNFLFNDVVPLIHEIISTIDNESESLEQEMHGTQIFSDYEKANLKSFSYRNKLKETLQDMLSLIYKERLPISDTKTSVDRSSTILPFMK